MTDEIIEAAPEQSLDQHMAEMARTPVAAPEVVAEAVPDAPDDKGDAPPDESEAGKKERDEAGRFREKSKDARENAGARARDAAAKEAQAKREAREAVAENARLRAENESYRNGRAPEAAMAPEPDNAPPKRFQKTPEPDPNEYARQGKSFDQYVKDLATDATTEATLRHEDSQKQEGRAKSYEHGIKTVLAAAQKQIDTAGGQKFLDTIHADVISLDPIGTHLGALIAQSEDVPGLMKYMSEHIDEFQLLQTLPPAQLSRKIGRIEERLSGAAPTAPSTAKLEVSKAGSPVRPVAGRSTTPPSDVGSMNFDSHYDKYYPSGAKRA